MLPHSFRILSVTMLAPLLATSVALAEETNETMDMSSPTTESSPQAGNAVAPCEGVTGQDRALCNLEERIKASGMEKPDCADISVERTGLPNAYCAIQEVKMLRKNQGGSRARELMNRRLQKAMAKEMQQRARKVRKGSMMKKSDAQLRREELRRQRKASFGLLQEDSRQGENIPEEGASNLESMMWERGAQARSMGVRPHAAPTSSSDARQLQHWLQARRAHQGPQLSSDAVGPARRAVNRPSARTLDQGNRRWQKETRKLREENSPIPTLPSHRDWRR